METPPGNRRRLTTEPLIRLVVDKCFKDGLRLLVLDLDLALNSRKLC
jgi:hypothetical protein